jgi:hypothetical protein
MTQITYPITQDMNNPVHILTPHNEWNYTESRFIYIRARRPYTVRSLSFSPPSGLHTQSAIQYETCLPRSNVWTSHTRECDWSTQSAFQLWRTTECGSQKPRSANDEVLWDVRLSTTHMRRWPHEPYRSTPGISFMRSTDCKTALTFIGRHFCGCTWVEPRCFS